MYKYKLCLRYLRTRYLAFVCIVSVMLGVATLIVVNSVMSGFSHKLKDRLLGTSADLTVATEYFGGFVESPASMMRRIQESPAGKHIAAIAPCIDVVGAVQFELRTPHGPQTIVKHCKVMGIDPVQQSKVGKFSEYLVNQRNAANPSFAVSDETLERFRIANLMKMEPREAPRVNNNGGGGDFLGAGPVPAGMSPPPIIIPQPDLPMVEPPKPVGVIVGDMIAHVRYTAPDGEVVERTLLNIGDPVMVATFAGDDMRPVWCTYVVADYFKSEMSEYDNQFVYLPLEELQRLRRMGGKVNSLQMKLADDTDKRLQSVKPNVSAPLEKLFERHGGTRVVTWQETQGPLLAAIDIERGILNLLLFMIVGVAGFSILAIFTMIVSEKYRDIGILKSLGASNSGVLGIFVWYAIFLGVVGCAAGSAVGLGITYNINEIEAWITEQTGQQLFDRSVYYFNEIPTQVERTTVLLVNAGAMIVAVLSSLVPAVRAARLRPIQALRFE